MQDLTPQNTLQNECGSESAIQEQLDRILASNMFHGSQRPGLFLRYVVEQTLQGQGEKIKEYTIATEVFGRDESFDPRLDPIVRVEATKLRSRLAGYYRSEGNQDPIRIDLSKRGYVPRFQSQGSECPVAQEVKVHVAQLKNPISAQRLSRMMQLVFAGIVLMSVAAFAVRSLRTAPPPLLDGKSIAVLPFSFLGDSKDDEYFSDGLTDELIASLGRVPGLRVAARGSVFQFKNKVTDIREVGRRLNVRNVLEGSVRKAGRRLRITVHLDDSTNGYRIWSDIYDRDADDALALQREIAATLSNSLGVKFSGNGQLLASNEARSQVNPEAYQAYLKGLFFWNKNTAASIHTAINYFEEAERTDPSYAPIYTGLGRCYEGLPVFTAMPSSEVVPKIRAVASKALSLDPTLGEAHLQLGEVAFLEYKWTEAERELKRALELSPNDGVVHRFYAYYLGRLGRNEEELAQTLAAQQLDPVSPYLAEGVGHSYLDLRRYDEAIEQYKNALKLDPGYVMVVRGLGLAYIYRGEYKKGIEELERAAKLDPEDISVHGELGYAYAMAGRRADAEKTLSILLDQSNQRKARPIRIAQVFIGLGNQDRAFEWLMKAVDEHEISLGPKTDPMFDSLRADPRFSEVLRRMNLL